MSKFEDADKLEEKASNSNESGSTEDEKTAKKSGDTVVSGGNNKSGDAEDEDSKTFSQDDLNRIMAREKKQGKRSVFKDLGLDPNDEDSIDKVKDFVSKLSQKDKGDSGDANKRTRSSADRELLDKVKKLEERTRSAELKSNMMTYGVKSDYLDDMLTLVKSRLDEIEDEDGEPIKSQLKKLVNEYKKKNPSWFLEKKSDDAKGTGLNVKGGDLTQGKGNKTLGERLAEEKVKRTHKKSSYWARS